MIFKFNMGPGWVELKFFSALLISFVVVAGPAWGQAGGALTLGAALQKAERQNLDLVAARARQAIAQAGIRIAGERPNPTLTFGALRDSPHEFVTVDQPLEIGPKRGRRIELARQESVLTDVEIRTLERLRSAREIENGDGIREMVCSFAVRQHRRCLLARAHDWRERLVGVVAIDSEKPMTRRLIGSSGPNSEKPGGPFV